MHPLKEITMTTIKDRILGLSRAIRTPVLPEVLDVIQDIRPEYDSVAEYKTSIVDWLKPIVDLSRFHVYPMNGITQGLDWWYDKEQRSVTMAKGDYQWIDPKDGTKRIHYVSVPSAIDGNFVDIPKDTPTAVDLAYVGSTWTQKINLPKNTEVVFYSLSKSFGVRNIRTGWIFTRQEDPRLEALVHNAKYYNYYANAVSEKIISKFPVDYIRNRLYTQQDEICKQLNVSPSDSVWLATTTDSDYDKFKRGNINRICLAGVYKL